MLSLYIASWGYGTIAWWIQKLHSAERDWLFCPEKIAFPFPHHLKFSSAQMNDYIHHIPQWAFMPVLWRDLLRLLHASKRREISPHQISANRSPGWYLPPTHPLLPLPLSGGLRADWQHLSSSLSIRFCSPPPPTVWVKITPYYPFFTVTVFNTHTSTIALQIHTQTNVESTHTHPHSWRAPAAH